MNPLLRGTAWHVPRLLDLKAMRIAAKLFVGKHDFQSFTANTGYKRSTTVRTLIRCDVKRSGPQFTFIIEGDGFLYKMCRGIVGTMVQVGLGKFPATEIKTMLAKKDRRVAGMTAPAQGLVLWKVFYSTQGRQRRKDAGKRASSDISGAGLSTCFALRLCANPNASSAAQTGNPAESSSVTVPWRLALTRATRRDLFSLHSPVNESEIRPKLCEHQICNNSHETSALSLSCRFGLCSRGAVLRRRPLPPRG